MTYLNLELSGSLDGDDVTTSSDASDAPTLRLSNPCAENGEPHAGPLSWLNSAAIRVDPQDDAVHLSVSVGDPRGAWVLTVRRLADGRLVMHVPHPGQGAPHVELTQLHEGTYQADGDYSGPEACDECGHVLEDDETTCPECGADVERDGDA